MVGVGLFVCVGVMEMGEQKERGQTDKKMTTERDTGSGKKKEESSFEKENGEGSPLSCLHDRPPAELTRQ